MDADAAMAAELQHLRWRRPDVTGAVLAGVDGLLVASDLSDPDAQHIAALAAASLGLGHRLAGAAGRGTLRECSVRAAGGHVVTYPAGRHALLTVLVQVHADLGRLHPEARAVAQRVGALFDAQLRPTTADARADPRLANPHAPLAVRTPMAARPADVGHGLRRRRSSGRG